MTQSQVESSFLQVGLDSQSVHAAYSESFFGFSFSGEHRWRGGNCLKSANGSFRSLQGHR